MTTSFTDLLDLLDGAAPDVATALDALEDAVAQAALHQMRIGKAALTPPLWDILVSRQLASPAEVERQAAAWRRAGEAGRARGLLHRAIEAFPGDAPLMVEYAAEATRARDTDAVRWIISTARARLGVSPEGRIALARVLLAAGKADEAAEMEACAATKAVADPASLNDSSRCALADALVARGSLSAAAYHISQATAGEAGFSRRQPVLRKRITSALLPLGLKLRSAALLYEKSGFAETLFSPEEFILRAIARLAEFAPYEDGDGTCFLVNTVAMGGSERNAVTMANAMLARGDHGPVTLMVAELSGDGHFGGALDAGVDTVRLYEGPVPSPEEAGADQAVAALLAAVPLRGMVDGVLRLAAALRRRRPRVLHVFASDVRNIQAGLAGMMAGVPVIVLNPGGMAPDSRGFGSSYQVNLRWMRAAFRGLMEAGRVRLLHCSIAALEDYRNWLDLDGQQRALQGVNYYGFDAGLWRPDPARVVALRAETGLAEGTFVLGTAFRFEDVKRPLLWVQIAEALHRRRPEARFVMVGGGSLHEAVRQAVGRGRLRDALVLPGRRSDMPDWYGMMSAFMMTSKAEGFGNVLLEAQAAGVPVVAPLIGGMPETFVHGRSGFVVTEDTVDAFCDRLVWMIDNPGWRAAAAHFGQRFVTEQFPAGRMIADCLRAHDG